MKKVRYAIGAAAVGLAPALALAVPGAAQAAAATPQLPGGAVAKAVSGHPLQPAYNYGRCTGTQEANEYTSSQDEWFWYTHEQLGVSTCIGTVDGYYDPYNGTQHPDPTYFRVRIWYYNTIASTAYGTITPGTGPGTFSGTTAFHQIYLEPVRVCAAWLTAHQGVIGSPDCITV